MPDETPGNDLLERALAELEAKRVQIDAAIAGLRAVIGMNPNVSLVNATPAGTETPASVKPGAFHGMTIPEAAKQLLAMRKGPMGNQEITDGLIAGGVAFTTETPVNTVGSVMHRAAKQGTEIVSVGRGKWGLAAWYPNPGRFQKKKAEERPDDETAEAKSADAADRLVKMQPWPVKAS